MFILLTVNVICAIRQFRTTESKTVLDNSRCITVERSDGTVDQYSGNSFPKAEKGDRITALIDLPERPGPGNYSVFSLAYNNIVTVRFEDEILFTYGTEQYSRHQQIGNVLITADIPDKAWGNTITFELFIADYSDQRSLPPLEILKSTDKTEYILKGNPFIFILSVAFIVVCLSGLIPCLLWKNGGRIKKEGMKLIFLSLSAVIWGIGYQQMQFVIFGNSYFTCNAEYFGIFSIPATYSMFLEQMQKKGKFKKVLNYSKIIFASVFFLFCLLNTVTSEWHFCRTLPVIHIFIAFLFILTGVYYYINRKSDQMQSIIIRNSAVILTGTSVLDACSFILNNRGIYCTTVLFTPFGIFSFILIMMTSYLFYLINFIIDARESKRLRKLAYTDGMTGVSNRRSCLEYIESLNSYSSPYGIVFIDVNDLKLANDKYSHDTGDKLICTVAHVLSEAFEGCFCGRYGGDEFIAGVKSQDINSDIEKRLRKVDSLICEINNTNQFPFKVTIAYGYASNTDAPDKTADEILSTADEKMYERKKAMKAAVKQNS